MDENKKEVIQLDMEQLNTVITNAVAAATKAAGMDSVDRKHGMFPDTDKKDEKELTKEQRFTKWFGAFVDGNMSSGLLQKATLVEGSGSGSYVVPVEYANEIAAVAGQFGKARRYANVITPASASLLIPDMTVDVSVTIPGENTAYSESIPTLLQKTLTIKTAGALSPMSNELLEDNSVNLLGFLSRRFGLALAKFEDTHTFGNSTSYWTPMLKLSSAGSVTIDSTSIAGVTADDISKMRRQVSEDYWPGCKFFMSPYVLSYVEELKDSAGNYIMRQPANGEGIRTIWGHEVVTVSGMPSADAANTEYIGFGDPSFCYFGVKNGMAIKLLDQATLTTAGNLAEKNLSAIRILERFGQVWTNEAGVAVLKTKA